MKRCPQCGREYDLTMSYCLDDGSELLYGPAGVQNDEPRTAILHDTSVPSEAATKAQIHTTNLPGVGDTRRDRTFPTKLVVVVAAIVLVLGGGFFGLRYFRADAKQINSIAVMPFVNESGNADIDYLTDGMTDTLISGLSQVPNLSVKAHTSVFRYKGKDIPSRTIANDLQVQALVSGRVTQHGDQMSVSVDLIDPQTESVLWSNKYDRKQTDLVSLQTDIAKDVSTKLRERLSGEDKARIVKIYTVDPEAYQLYLKGKFYWNQRTAESLKKAAESYNQAIAKDPGYALAYSGLAETYLLYSSHDVAPASDSMPQAKAAALRALQLDDQLAEAHAALGFYLANYEWDRTAFEKEYRRAIELKPDYATAHHWFGADLSCLKRVDASLAEYRVAEELDPLSPQIGTNFGDALLLARRYDEAIDQYKRVILRDPDFAYAHQALGLAYGAQGKYAEAIAEARRSIELDDSPSRKGYLGLWLAKSGQRDEARKVLAELKQKATVEYVENYSLALLYIGLGNKNEALGQLESEVSGRAENANTFAAAPELDDLRSEPRFKAMLKQMNLPE